MYQLQLTEDELSPGTGADPLWTQHAIIYAWKGAADINGERLHVDNAVYVEDQAVIAAGNEGATLWRWEIVPTAQARQRLAGTGVRHSVLKMARRVKMFELVPTSNWLFRLDCIKKHQGSTGLHSHPGSGIRCMLNGHLRIASQKGESSDNGRPGDSWYEEGAYPLVSTAGPGLTATFLRGMVLPPEFEQYAETANWIEGVPATNAGWHKYLQRVVTLR